MLSTVENSFHDKNLILSPKYKKSNNWQELKKHFEAFGCFSFLLCYKSVDCWFFKNYLEYRHFWKLWPICLLLFKFCSLLMFVIYWRRFFFLLTCVFFLCVQILSFYFPSCGELPPPVIMVQNVNFRYDETKVSWFLLC